MNIVTKIPDEFDWSSLTELFSNVGWGYREPNVLKQAFSYSNNIVLIYDQEQLIGCGRSVDDGNFYALLVDIIVKPEYQKKGIGSIILNSLTGALNNLPWVVLSAEVGKEEFYQKNNFKKMKYGFMLPKNERQSKQYCED